MNLALRGGKVKLARVADCVKLKEAMSRCALCRKMSNKVSDVKSYSWNYSGLSLEIEYASGRLALKSLPGRLPWWSSG